MHSRERVLAALRHEEADRVPIDFDGMRSTGIAAIAYNRLKAHLGLRDRPTRVYDVMQQLAHPDPEVLELFGADVLAVTRAPLGFDVTRPGWKPWALPDGSDGWLPSELDARQTPEGDWIIPNDKGEVEYRMPTGAPYFEPVHHSLERATTVAEIEALPLPDISEIEVAWMRAEGQRLRATTDKAIMTHTGYNIYETAQRLRGWEQFMVDLGEDSPLAHALLQRLADQAERNLTRILAAVGEYVDIVQLGDDLGTQRGPQLSPRMYRRMVKPYHAQVYGHIKRISGKPLFLHCCGGVYPLLPDLIEAGVDILNPIQFTAEGMEPARLKREFGRDLVFWGGGADTQHVLPNASPDEVRDHVRRLVDIFGPGGGFVFSQVHNIQAGVPPENIIAMFETAREAGRYRVPAA